MNGHSLTKVRTLRDFMILDELERAAGMLLVFGGIDDRTARYAVGLLKGFLMAWLDLLTAWPVRTMY